MTMIKREKDTKAEVINTVWIVVTTLALLYHLFIHFKMFDKYMCEGQIISQSAVGTVILFSLIGVSGIISQIKGYKNLTYSIEHGIKSDKHILWMGDNGLKIASVAAILEFTYMCLALVKMSPTMHVVMFIISILMYTVLNTVETYVLAFLAFRYTGNFYMSE